MPLWTICKNALAITITAFTLTVANAQTSSKQSANAADLHYLSKPLITNMYTADPSAHVFNGRIYIYPSHDIDAGIPEKDTLICATITYFQWMI
jgi:hypothetical protein